MKLFGSEGWALFYPPEQFIVSIIIVLAIVYSVIGFIVGVLAYLLMRRVSIAAQVSH